MWYQTDSAIRHRLPIASIALRDGTRLPAMPRRMNFHIADIEPLAEKNKTREKINNESNICWPVLAGCASAPPGGKAKRGMPDGVWKGDFQFQSAMANDSRTEHSPAHMLIAICDGIVQVRTGTMVNTTLSARTSS